jgi:multimeric flavodoxin WrbA
MKVVCLSASNVEAARRHSASTQTSELVRDIIFENQTPAVDVQILPLIDYELKPCCMCGRCFDSGRCVRDEAYNQIFEELSSADRIFIVAPHYATIPSKLVMLFEKIQEMAYLKGCADENYCFLLADKPVGLIAHGGQTEEALPAYQKGLLKPMANILGSVGMQVVGPDDDHPDGVVFGITSLNKSRDSIFVDIQHDWESIRQRITPLVEKVMQA